MECYEFLASVTAKTFVSHFYIPAACCFKCTKLIYLVSSTKSNDYFSPFCSFIFLGNIYFQDSNVNNADTKYTSM